MSLSEGSLSRQLISNLVIVFPFLMPLVNFLFEKRSMGDVKDVLRDSSYVFILITSFESFFGLILRSHNLLLRFLLSPLM